MKARSVVPCDGCKVCCVRETIILHPECGYVVASYDAAPIKNPITGATDMAIRHKPNGECVYLGDTGCTIWSRAPIICKEFDCRQLFARFTNRERKDLLKAGVLEKETLAAGKLRLHTL